MSNFYRKIRQIIDTFGSNLNVELQQRGTEFSQLFRKYDNLRSALLERMPPMETAKPQANGIIGMMNGDQDNNIEDDKQQQQQQQIESQQQQQQQQLPNTNALLDLLGTSDLNTSTTSTLHNNNNSTIINTSNSTDLLDLLGGLDLGTTNDNNTGQIQTPQLFQSTGNNQLDGLLNTNVIKNESINNMTVLDKSGLKITFRLERPAETPNTLEVNMLAINLNDTTLTDFLFQAAVPRVSFNLLNFTLLSLKYIYFIYLLQIFQLQVLPPSSNIILPSGQVTQVLKVSNLSNISALRMRLRISYNGDSGPVLEQTEVNNFPNIGSH